jgi:hypothetical protein
LTIAEYIISTDVYRLITCIFRTGWNWEGYFRAGYLTQACPKRLDSVVKEKQKIYV